MTGWTVRTFVPGDERAMSDVFFAAVRQLGPRRYTPEQVRAWAPAPTDPTRLLRKAQDGRETLIAIDRDGRVAGFGDLEPDGHIDLLYCRPDMAGTGIADAILAGLIDHARRSGMTHLFVEASELARSLFERAGYAVSHRQDVILNGVAIHHYVMTRRSPPQKP